MEDPMIERFESATVGEIVATDSRAAAVFEQFGIDFCCGGGRALSDACRSARVDPADVSRALAALSESAVDGDDVTLWPIDRLIDHIVATHHAYVREALPAIARHLTKLQEVHGTRHPELARVAHVFGGIDAELSQHLLKEERILFPYIRDLADRDERTRADLRSPFGTVENPIRMMEREHREAADALGIVRELTRGYTVPDDGCATYRVCMDDLARFERDLHRHVHLENNVLFPRAVALESRSSSHQ
jgi:regulator of cell morphogenesis and NO signaling